MAVAKALGGGFPIGACLATTEAAKGMTPGTHGSTFGGNPLAMAVGNAVLDVMLAPGFLEHVQRCRCCLKQQLAGICDRYPDIASEVRGKGLLIGIKAVIPAGDLSNALRDEKLLTVAAGDNVVRLLPPLIVNEAEIEEAVEAHRARLREAESGPAKRGGRVSSRLAISSTSGRCRPATCARCSTTARPCKQQRKAANGAGADQPLAGKTLAMIFEKPSTRTRVSFDVGMRQLGGEAIMLTGAEMQLGRGETIADTARVLSRYVDAIMIRILSHDDAARARRSTPPCR